MSPSSSASTALMGRHTNDHHSRHTARANAVGMIKRARCCGDLHQAEGEEWRRREDDAAASTRYGSWAHLARGALDCVALPPVRGACTSAVGAAAAAAETAAARAAADGCMKKAHSGSRSRPIRGWEPCSSKGDHAWKELSTDRCMDGISSRLGASCICMPICTWKF